MFRCAYAWLYSINQAHTTVMQSSGTSYHNISSSIVRARVCGDAAQAAAVRVESAGWKVV